MVLSFIYENFKFNSVPIGLTLFNLAHVNLKQNNKKTIRILTFVHGIIGCLILYCNMPDSIRFQIAIEWITMYSIAYYPFFEKFLLGKIKKYIYKYWEMKEDKQGITYTEKEKEWSYLVSDYIFGIAMLFYGVVTILLVSLPLFDLILNRQSDLYYLAKYNYIIASISCIVRYLNDRKLYLLRRNTYHE